ncbi:redoxin domain-containing protein [Micromonospora sp. WMMA1363]|uniref:redoxin domain-containing protein n=1 Tax=Micromonospora sp. WMMA1363 TaxID=3053985 RepID=UPI00259CA206|nr:redoxin domain-containing protein [Micromonospora sp. WMMA1363]MDM4720217.1 redoxin domain-containing protein [Micromonospora sp. WMMA1363]
MRRLSGTVLATVTAVALLGTAACGGDGGVPATAGPNDEASPTGGTLAATGAPSATGTPSVPVSSPAQRPVTVPATLTFAAKTLDGTAFDAARLAGRPVVLWFWAPWCATCASQAWTVAEVAPRYRDTVPVIGVAGLGQQRAMKDFVTEFELAGVPQLDDRAGALWRRFEVVEQSTFVILDRAGTVIHHGFLDGEALTRQLATLAQG